MSNNPEKRIKANKTSPQKPVRIRCGIENCGCGNQLFEDGLFVLTAPTTNGFDLQKSKFKLWKTNSKGKLQLIEPILSKNNIVQSQEYAVYIIVHFDQKFAEKCLELINNGDIKKFGKPHKLTAIKSGKKFLEFKIPDHKIGFIPSNEKTHTFLKGKELKLIVGHKNYDFQVLYENMPNANCQWIKDNIFKLQLHLGHMRYPIGGVFHPYYPCDREDKYKSQGIFEKKTYNSVLAFYRDANKKPNPNGVYFEKYETMLDNSFDKENCLAPTKALIDNRNMEQTDNFSLKPNFTKNFEEPPLHESIDSPSPNKKPDTFTLSALPEKTSGNKIPYIFVDDILGSAIEHWITKGFRKAGRILVSVKTSKRRQDKTFMLWLRDDFAKKFLDWDKKTCEYGMGKSSIEGGWSYRDIRKFLYKKKPGTSARSLHKTGLAIDLPNYGYTKCNKETFPLIYQLEQLKNKRFQFRLFVKISDGNHRAEYESNNDISKSIIELKKCLSEKDNVLKFYPESVSQWEYNKSSRLGGIPKKITGKTYLDITLIAKALGISRINSHERGWKLGKELKFNNDNNSFNNIITKLDNLRTNNKLAEELGAYITSYKSNKKTLIHRLEGKPVITLVQQTEMIDSKQNSSFNGSTDSLQQRVKIVAKHEHNSSFHNTDATDATDVSDEKCSVCEAPFFKGDKILISPIEMKDGIQQHYMHETCFKHEQSKLYYQEYRNTKLKKKNVEDRFHISHTQLDILSKWNSSITQIKEGPFFSNVHTKPGILVSMQELKLLHRDVLSTSTDSSCAHGDIVKSKNILEKTLFLVTYENHSNQVESIIIEGEGIYSHIEKNTNNTQDKDWSCSITPALGSKELPFFLDKCTIQIPKKGKPIHMEWWHYQDNSAIYHSKNGTKTAYTRPELMEQIGWTKEGLKYIGY